MSTALESSDPGGRLLLRVRLGQILGLLFLIGPLSDLARSSASPARTTAIVAVVGAFVVLYLAVLPPARPLARRGGRRDRARRSRCSPRRRV